VTHRPHLVSGLLLGVLWSACGPISDFPRGGAKNDDGEGSNDPQTGGHGHNSADAGAGHPVAGDGDNDNGSDRDAGVAADGGCTAPQHAGDASVPDGGTGDAGPTLKDGGADDAGPLDARASCVGDKDAGPSSDAGTKKP
jgi:hypothetical protein